MHDKLRKLLKDRRGNVAIITALSVPVLVVAIGGAADYANILRIKAKLQTAVDSATLATLKHAQQKSDITNAQVKAYFENHLRQNTRHLGLQLRIDEVQVSYLRREVKLNARVKGATPTTFLKFVAIPEMPLNVQAQSKASLNYTEVALVLDTTSSMEGAKLQELKRAATSFLETIHQKLGEQNPEAFRVAIVPFAEYVNVGMQHRNASWIKVPQDRTITETAEYCEKWVCDEEGQDEIGTVCTKGRHVPINPCIREEVTLNVRWQGCVGSRPEPYNTNDGNYSVPVPGVMNFKRNIDHPEDTLEGWLDWDPNRCGAPLTPLMNLKTQKARLISSINALVANGYTYIPSGLVWGWRVLSPDAPFTEGADARTVKEKNVRKIIILMTDGENTRAPGTVPYEPWRDWADHGAEDKERANRFTRRLCDNIKSIDPRTGRRNAEIITITFDIQSPAIKALMQECASLGSYDAGSGQLVQVFDNIAKRLVELHLSR